MSEPGPVVAPARTERGQRRRTIAAAATAAGVVLVLAVALLRPAGVVLADVTEHGRAANVLPAIDAPAPIRQRFVASADGLSEVSVRFATYRGNTRCTVDATLRDATGDVVGSRTLACGDLDDSEVGVAVAFPPVPDSEGQTYELELRRGDGDELVTVWGTIPEPGEEAARSGDEALDLRAELHTGYEREGRAWSVLDDALDRMGAFGPFWRDPFAVVAIAAVALAALVAVVAAPRRLKVAAVVLLALSKGVLWSVVTPPLEGVDEIAHYGYVQFMAEEQRIPKRGHDEGGSRRTYSEEVSVALERFHVTASPPGDRPDFTAERIAAAERELRVADEAAGGDGAAAGYAPLFYAPGALLYSMAPDRLDDRVAVVRLWSVLLGAVTAYLAVGIGRRLFPRHPAAAIALGVAVALHPMASQQQAIINNDALVIAAGTWCMLLALDLARPRRWPELTTALLAGVALGIALLAKPFGAAFGPVLLVAWLIGWRRSTSRKGRLVEAVHAAVGFATTYGVWAAVSVVGGYRFAAVGDFPATDAPKTLRTFAKLQTEDGFLAVRTNWADQFWGNFSWIDTPFPSVVRNTITIALSLGVVAVVVWAIRVGVDRAPRRRGRDEGDVHTFLCILAVAATIALLYLLAILTFRHTGTNDLLQGRYALLVVAPLLALPALLARRLAPGVPPTAVVVALAAAMAVLNVWGLGLLVERFYL